MVEIGSQFDDDLPVCPWRRWLRIRAEGRKPVYDRLRRTLAVLADERGWVKTSWDRLVWAVARKYPHYRRPRIWEVWHGVSWLRSTGAIYVLHRSEDLMEILVCPVTKGPLEYDAEKQELISRSAKLAYPIRGGIPIMLPEEARRLD